MQLPGFDIKGMDEQFQGSITSKPHSLATRSAREISSSKSSSSSSSSPESSNSKENLSGLWLPSKHNRPMPLHLRLHPVRVACAQRNRAFRAKSSKLSMSPESLMSPLQGTRCTNPKTSYSHYSRCAMHIAETSS